MKKEWSFPRQVLAALAIIIALTVYPLLRFASSEFITAVVFGGVLATVNVLLGYAAIEYSIGKSAVTFFKYVLGGMGIRLLLMVGLIGLFIKVFHVDVTGLIVSLAVFYIVFLMLEILFIQKKVSIKQHS